MKKIAALIVALLPLCGFGMDRLSALSMLETGNDDRAVGSAGEISRFQVKKAEWRTVTNSANYCDSETARKVMIQLMDKRIHTFEEHFGRKPTDFEFYALWNAPAQNGSFSISQAGNEFPKQYPCHLSRKGCPTLVNRSIPVQPIIASP
jgi:hypothetical protein